MTDKQLPLRLFTGGLLILGLVAILLLVFHPFFYITLPGNATVMFNTFSGIEKGRIERPGVTFVLPVIDAPITYNVRTRVWQFADGDNIPNQAGNAIAVNSADGQAFTTDVFVALRPNQETLDELHARIGQQYMTTVVVPTVRSKVRDIAAEFNSNDFYKKERRIELEKKMTALISREMPFIEVKASLEQKQVASISAQTAAVNAQIQQKETTRKLILADANRQSIELQGKAASRNGQLANLLFYEKLSDRIETARGKGEPIPIKVIRVEGGDKSTIFINVDPQRAATGSP
jgi:prohibitin 2